MKTTAKFEGTRHDVSLEDTDHLKSCPFCGSTDIELQHTWTAAYWLQCQGCGTEVNGESFPRLEVEADHLASARSAVEKWNRRTMMVEATKE